MSDIVNYYQTIPELGIKGRMNTPEEFDKVGLPGDLNDWTVLDVGCNIGAFMLECMKRGAAASNGVEPDIDWRLIAWGVGKETRHHMNLVKQIDDLPVFVFDLVLCLSVSHLVEDPQWLITQCNAMANKLFIFEINDRLQEDKFELPKGAKFYGKNKDNRSVYHVWKS